jgi:hypothetical protein
LLLRRALERSSENSQPAVVERDGAVKSRGVICRGSANGAGLEDPR